MLMLSISTVTYWVQSETVKTSYFREVWQHFCLSECQCLWLLVGLCLFLKTDPVLGKLETPTAKWAVFLPLTPHTDQRAWGRATLVVFTFALCSDKKLLSKQDRLGTLVLLLSVICHLISSPQELPLNRSKELHSLHLKPIYGFRKGVKEAEV